MITDASQITDPEARKRLFKLIERRQRPAEVMTLLGLDKAEVAAHVFESCSFVAALTDGKTVVDACYCPEGIHVREDPDNPLFRREAA